MQCPVCSTPNPATAALCEKCNTPLPLGASPPTLEDSGATEAWSAPATPHVLNRAGAQGNLAIGSVLAGRYEILQLLGQGGMGAVYKARDVELDRVIALKLIRPELASRQDILRRFKQELILARQVTQKNVIRIFDLGEASGIKFITMEYIEGRDLKTLLRERHKLPPDEAIEIMKQICRALEAAHGEGVIHRDLKPQNIMVDKQGKVSVMDFGIARSVEIPGMTQTGALMGTPEYMSPEQAKGERVDERSDLFAAGLVFYELLTGKTPYEADTALGSLLKRTREPAAPPVALDSTIPKVLSDVANRCLEIDPERRYQSAREIVLDLESGTAPPRSRTVKIPLPMPTRRAAFVAAAVAMLLLVIFFSIPRTRNFLLRRHGGDAARGGIPSLAEGKYVAVVPFRVVGDAASLGYIADGLVEALTAKLFGLRDVRVASSTAVSEAGQKESLEKLARALGVNLIVNGMVQGAGDKIRVIVNLEDAGRGRRLWSQEFSGVTQDLLTVEDQIYSQLVAALELRPTREELARSGAHPTENIEAYDLYLKGRNTLRGQHEIKNIEAAMSLFEQAVQKDRTFALAYAGLADASLLMYREKKDSLWSQKALAAVQQAQRLNDDLPEVHFTLGSVYSFTGKSSEATAELKRALELAPNSDEAYRRLGEAYLASGLKAEAIQASQKAVQVNPYYWVNTNALGSVYLRLGDTEKALSAYHRVTELEPDNPVGYENVGVTYLREGKYNEAIAALQKALALQQYESTYDNLGFAYFFLGRYAEAAKMFEKAVEMSPNDEVAVGNLADAYRWSGQREKAQATYDRAIALTYKALEVNPRSAASMGSLSLYYAKKGESARALEFIRRARSINRNDVGLIYIQALVETLANRADRAVSALAEAFQKGYPVEEAKNDPELNTLRNNAEFQKLLKQYEGKTR